MEPLLPCPGCDRHVRCGDGACPFCGAALELVAPCRMPVTQRLGRAAYFAFRTLTVGAVGASAGCGAATGLEGPGDAGVDAGEGTVDAGAPVPGTDAGFDAAVDSGVDAGVDAGFDAGTMGGFLYGAPPVDAGFDAGSGIVDLYGGPPMLDAGEPDAGSEALYGGPPGP